MHVDFTGGAGGKITTLQIKKPNKKCNNYKELLISCNRVNSWVVENSI